ncbi:sucrose-6-phosphate hydrolase [Lactobacillus acetotolerans]|uniref:sucrose-6-phosphate hydrolase n=1 Tax=Lactobacillus acetotolerans TaxID=1600 RepID=UPI0019D02295|nr:sucrose-6-phosphate hydrolase [Lactobacillus acetotolerans]MBN7276042.1 sucrose-6-phosphate hydrolase [Lactobacillus acetotolerans]
MNWTTEKRYLPYDKWPKEVLKQLQKQAARSKYQMHYHLHPISGLINDPNGFSYFNGKYHLFCQSYPFGPVHGLKSWVHFKSKDLVHWKYLGLAIKPDTMADSHGAYSGSAKTIGNKLFIMYTGNHRDKNWKRVPYQIGAWMDKNGTVQDKHILFKNPSHITEHFRDPQILKENGHYYALVGAQDSVNKHGHIDLWQSDDLKDWHELGFLKFSKHNMGYMIECPNLVKFNGKVILIFCPQGLDKKVAEYDNIYPNMYVIGDKIDWENHKIINSGKLKNLDDEFDVYASQAFNAPDGKVYEISWVGLPDTTYPTDSENWANCLSQVKELTIENGKLMQRPVPAMKSLHYDEEKISRDFVKNNVSGQYELKITIPANKQGTLHLAANEDLSQSLQIIFDTENGSLTLDRSKAGKPVSVKYGQSRIIKFAEKKELKLDIFVDHSLIEIFANDGEHVMTGRYFSNPEDQKIVLDKNSECQGKFWKIKSIL